MLRTASKQLNKVIHTAPKTAKRVKSSEQNFDKMAVRSLSKIESTDCFEYCSEFFSKISVGAECGRLFFRAASGVLSNIDHQKKNQISTKLFEISTTQHYIDQISTTKVP